MYRSSCTAIAPALSSATKRTLDQIPDIPADSIPRPPVGCKATSACAGLEHHTRRVDSRRAGSPLADEVMLEPGPAAPPAAGTGRVLWQAVHAVAKERAQSCVGVRATVVALHVHRANGARGGVATALVTQMRGLAGADSRCQH